MISVQPYDVFAAPIIDVDGAKLMRSREQNIWKCVAVGVAVGAATALLSRQLPAAFERLKAKLGGHKQAYQIAAEESSRPLGEVNSR